MPPAISDDDISLDGQSPPKNEDNSGAVQENDDKILIDSLNGEPGEVKDDDEEEEDNEDDGEDDDDDAAADEYVVDAIINHAFEPDGSVKYEVRWAGYDETTWEPLTNLNTCRNKVSAYHRKIGGPPTRPIPKASSSKGKRKLSTTPMESNTGKGTRRKKRKSEEPVEMTGNKRLWKPPSGSWETEITSIDTVEKDVEGNIIVFLVWKQGSHRSKHPSPVVRRKCPQKLLDFYESHLHFNHASGNPGENSVT